MRLIFSLSVQDVQQRGNDIISAVTAAYPGAHVAFPAAAGTMSVEFPCMTDDPMKVASDICRVLSSIGVSASPAIMPPSGFSPIYSPPKKRRTVPLSVFIISLVAVVLCMSTLFVFVGGVLGGFPLGYGSTLGTGEQEGEDYAGKIALIDQIFEQYSLYDTDGKLLLDNMLKAYAASTGDRYAAYYTQEEYEQMMSENAAKMVGIGITIGYDAATGGIRILDILPESPALAAGVQVGDVIVAVGTPEQREEVSAIGYEKATNRLLGEVGTKAEFIVLRDGAERAFSIERVEIKTLSVRHTVSITDPAVGIIKISQFDLETPAQFKAAMEALKTAGCTRLVFDVRSNPGGDLKSIIAVLSYFLEKNKTIVSTEMKDGTKTVYAADAATYTDDYAACSVAEEEIGMYRSYIGSMTVLTNGNTASAAELFTIVMKDYHLATVVGTKTKGKGVIQSIIPLDRWGYEGAVKLTFGHYNPPVSPNYEGVGIEPDMTVELDEEAAKKGLYLLEESEDNQLQAAIGALQSN